MYRSIALKGNITEPRSFPLGKMPNLFRQLMMKFHQIGEGPTFQSNVPFFITIFPLKSSWVLFASLFTSQRHSLSVCGRTRATNANMTQREETAFKDEQT